MFVCPVQETIGAAAKHGTSVATATNGTNVTAATIGTIFKQLNNAAGHPLVIQKKQLESNLIFCVMNLHTSFRLIGVCFFNCRLRDGETGTTNK